MKSWNFASPQAKLSLIDSSNFTLNAGTQYIIKVVLRDHDNSLGDVGPVGNGTGFTISNDPNADANAGTASQNSSGIQIYGFRLVTSNAAMMGLNPDTVTNNNTAGGVSVWNTAGGTGAPTGNTATRENRPSAISDAPSTTAYTVASNPLNTDPTNNHTSVSGEAAFNPTGRDVLYPLANLLITAGSVGSGQFTLQKAGAAIGTNFATSYTPDGIQFFGVDLDPFVWGAGGTNTYQIPFTVVPEPSSMVLAGLAVSGLGYRLRRKFFGKKAAAE